MNPIERPSESSRVPRFPRNLDDLRSTTQCPMCFTSIDNTRACVECGLDLQHPELAAVFTRSTLVADALIERGNLVVQAWQQSQQASLKPVAMPEPPLPVQQVPAAAVTSPSWASAAPPVPMMPQAPAPPPIASSSAPRRSGIQLVLLIIGVSFVSIAAIVFLTVAFVLFDLTVKAVIIAGVTAGVIALATWLKRKHLNATAEGVAILGVVLLLLDLWAIRALNLFGLEQVPGTLFWGVGLLGLTAVLLGWGRLATLRAPQLASTFTFGPGVFALVRWLFDWAFTAESATLIGLAGLAVASLLSPILHRQNNKPDPLEVGVVFGIGQLATGYLVVQSLVHLFRGETGLPAQTELSSLPHPLEIPLVTMAVCLIAAFAVFGQQRALRKHETLARIRWFRIGAVVLQTLLWATFVLVIAARLLSSTPNYIDEADLTLALPLIGLAAVAWDVLRLRSVTQDRAQWLSGMITTAVAALVPFIVLVVTVGFLPLMRTMTSNLSDYSIDGTLFTSGIAIAVCGGVAIGAYLGFARAAQGLQRRITIAAIIVATGVALAAVALPVVPSIVVLGVMMIGAIAVTARLGRERLPSIRSIVFATYVAGAAGLLGISFLHRPLALATFAAVGIGFLILRVLRGAHGAMPLTLAASFFAVITTFVSWSPDGHPIMSVIFAMILPALLLLIASGWHRLDVTDRRVFGWVATLLLFVIAVQQIPLSIIPLDSFPAQSVWALCIAAAIAFATGCVLIFATLRAARGSADRPVSVDPFTPALTLTTTVPLGYIVVSPFVQFVTVLSPAPVAEIMFVWVVVIGALVSAALLTLARLNGLPGKWTLVADYLAAFGAFSAMATLLVLTIPDNYELPTTAVIALLLAVAVPLTLSVRSNSGQPRGRIRGVLPWLAAGFFAAFGPALVVHLISAPWPLLIAAPIAVALLVTTLVFQVSGAASRSHHGSWVVGGMLTFGVVLPLATALGSRGFVAAELTWLPSLIVGLLAVGGLVISTVGPGRARFTPTHLLLASVLAPLSVMALVTTVSDALEYVADTGTLAPGITSSLLAITTGGATVLALYLLNRATTWARDSVSTGARTPHEFLHFVGLGGIAFVAMAALMLPPQMVDIALTASAIALAFTISFSSNVPCPLSRTYSVLSIVGLALLVSLTQTLLATFDGQHIEHPLVAVGITVIVLVATTLLALRFRRGRALAHAHPLPLRTLHAALVPLGIWAALMAAPVVWPWWMLVAAAVLSVAVAVGVAVFRSRVGMPEFTAAGISAFFPLITALFVTDESVRAWPVAWLAVGVSLLALGFAVTHAIGLVARTLGTILALVSSAMLLWPANPDAAVLLVALPGCVLLAVMAVVTAALRYRLEPDGYAAAVPVWFAVITAAASDAISDNVAVIIMVVMLIIAVAATAAATTRTPGWVPHRFMFLLLTAGSGVAALITMVLSFLNDVTFPNDVYFLAFGLAVAAVGGLWMRAKPNLRSVPALGPGLAVLLIPLWGIEAGEPTAPRIGIFTALVLATVLIGALGKLKAPLIIGLIAALAHLIVAVRWMLPELSLPWWAWLGSAGALLIFVAATYEARLRNAKTLVRSISQLR